MIVGTGTMTLLLARIDFLILFHRWLLAEMEVCAPSQIGIQ